MDDGEIFTYALGKLDDRGRMFVRPNDPVYEGMIVGIHSRDNDLVVNATRTKQLTNFRVSGKEDAIKITPPIELTLEYGVEFIEGRRTSRDHAEERAAAQTLSQRARAQEGVARSGLNKRFLSPTLPSVDFRLPLSGAAPAARRGRLRGPCLSLQRRL